MQQHVSHNVTLAEAAAHRFEFTGRIDLISQNQEQLSSHMRYWENSSKISSEIPSHLHLIVDELFTTIWCSITYEHVHTCPFGHNIFSNKLKIISCQYIPNCNTLSTGPTGASLFPKPEQEIFLTWEPDFSGFNNIRLQVQPFQSFLKFGKYL